LRRTILLAVLSLMLVALHAAAAAADSDIGNAANDLRNGWYQNAGSLSPGVVTGGSFGETWSANVDGQVYAQPLYDPASGEVVVATETDWVYGLNAITGAIEWYHQVAPTPWNPADIGCGDIAPAVGTTATPVIDTATDDVYLTYKTYVSGSSGPAAWYMTAYNVLTGAVVSGFPTELQGTAQNDPNETFDATTQQQRPGLLLTDGVVYAAFGGHCDDPPFEGWVFGVSTTGQTTARWIDTDASSYGPGIWQSGVGLMSNAPGSIFFVSGNGFSPTVAVPGHDPPVSFGESAVHLEVQPNGTLEPVDFFAPFDASELDTWDGDFGAGALIGLPPAQFGTPSMPNLGVVAGKEGYVYLLNLDNLGGFEQGTGGGDNVVQRLGPRSGVWGRPGVWGGDGGYIYLVTQSSLDTYQYGLTGDAQPSLALAASDGSYGWGAGPAVVTSDGTTSGSAIVWTVWSADRTGTGAQLRAYSAVPSGGTLNEIWSMSIGTSTNYSDVDYGDKQLYLGTRDGKVLAFGSPVTQKVSGSSLSYPSTVDGSSVTEDLTVRTSTPALPAELKAGQTTTIPVTFQPTASGEIAGEIDITLGDGSTQSFSVSGNGETFGPNLSVTQDLISFGGTIVGSELTASDTFTNIGSQAVTIASASDIQLPNAPFSVSGQPSSFPATVDPGKSFAVTLEFQPAAQGNFTDTLEVDSNGGDPQVGLSGSASGPGLLAYSSENIGFGSVALGSNVTKSFTITNVGGETITVNKSKPPFGGEFAANTSLDEGTTIAAGASLTEQVTFTPTTTGAASGLWVITGDDGQGLQEIEFSGTGVQPTIAQAPLPTTPITVTATSVMATLRDLKLSPIHVEAAQIRRSEISYATTEAGTTDVWLARARNGRSVNGKCVASTRADRRHLSCVYYVTVARFTHTDQAGRNTLMLHDYVDVRHLALALYRVGIEPANDPGAEWLDAWFRLD
jgi:hypothetical protein